MELALDFEACAGWPLPPAPQSNFVGGDMSLQEKGRVAATDCHSGGQGHGTRVYLPGQDDAPLPLPHINGGRHGHGTGGPPHLHEATGNMDTLGEAPNVRGD